jgi:hypothetical protein
MTARIHFFALADPYLAHLFCGDFREGDGWTAVPQGVTCAECRRRVEAETAQRQARDRAGEQHAT